MIKLNIVLTHFYINSYCFHYYDNILYYYDSIYCRDVSYSVSIYSDYISFSVSFLFSFELIPAPLFVFIHSLSLAVWLVHPSPSSSSLKSLLFQFFPDQTQQIIFPFFFSPFVFLSFFVLGVIPPAFFSCFIHSRLVAVWIRIFQRPPVAFL